jgi:ABC-2 type transport system ATP-binding protein
MKTVLKATNLTYSIPYSRTIYSNVNIEILAGEIVGVLGANGAGKTTLIDIITGNRNHYSGEIKILNEVPFEDSRQNRDQIVFISQDLTLPGTFKIGEYTNFFSQLYPLYNRDIEKDLLNRFSLSADTKIGSLSTGQQRKVQIIAGLAALPKVLIVDEITAVLDPETRSHFFDALLEFQKSHQLTTILATNIAEDLIDITSKIIFINNEKVEIHPSSDILKLFNVEKA